MSDKQQRIFQAILDLLQLPEIDVHNIERLAKEGLQAASHPPAVKGAVWVKAENMPERRDQPYIIKGAIRGYPIVTLAQRNFDDPNPKFYFEYEGASYLVREGWEYLDESPTAAGDGEAREMIENILYATGKFFEEQCTELADIILKEIKGAGDGKEAIEFAEWAMNNFGIARNSSWKKIWAGPGPKQFATAQLYDIFKNRNK